MAIMPEGRRTPQNLAKEAIEIANAACSVPQALKAVTMAIVALAGEVHALRDAKIDMHVERLFVEGIDV